MKFVVVSLFPEIVEHYFRYSILARAVAAHLVSLDCVNIRDFATDRQRTCDDAAYGGGPGMVMLPEPLGRALDSLNARQRYTIFPTPVGRRLDQEKLLELKQKAELIFICGHYEGVDQRIIDLYVNEELSIGDYVISSGELAALVIMDGISRLLDGVINLDSLTEESFEEGLLEYPHYTRPAVYDGLSAPEVLLSGDHKKIAQWRFWQRVERTMRNARRPDDERN